MSASNRAVVSADQPLASAAMSARVIDGKAVAADVRARVARIPGVESVSWASNMPLWARSVSGLQVEGYQPRSQADKISTIVDTVDTNYFETAGVALESGREFTNLDQEKSTPVAIVNEKLVHD